MIKNKQNKSYYLGDMTIPLGIIGALALLYIVNLFFPE